MAENKPHPIGSLGIGVPRLPLIRLNTAIPLVKALDQSGVSTDSLLEGLGLSRAAFADPDNFVHATVIYQFFEEAAKAARDPQFATHVGETVNTANWDPIVELGKTAKTVGDFLTAFAVAATQHSSATLQCLEIRGKKAVFLGRRSFEPSMVPAQIDGFFVGLLVAIIRRASGANWKPSEVMVILSDPGVLPPIFHGITALQGDRKGYRIQFPAEWLRLPFDQPGFLQRSKEEATNTLPAHKMGNSVKQALRPHLGEVRLTVAQAAKICGLNRRKLERLLAREGSTVGALIDELKHEAAIEALAHTDRSVVDIAAALGYSDPTSFARSFKRWTGVSPRSYRRSMAP